MRSCAPAAHGPWAARGVDYHSAVDGPDPEIIVTDEGVELRWRHGIGIGCVWEELEEVAVSVAPAGDGLDGWLILRDRSETRVPVWLSVDEGPLRALFDRLPGFDPAALDAALDSEPGSDVVVWRRPAPP